eukprot:scaffold53811_cov58-Phaeocystis_antarctica.AAC.2
MLHAVHPKSCEGTTSPERSCSPGMWVALTTCPPCHSDSHRLRDGTDGQLATALWVGFEAGRLGLRTATYTSMTTAKNPSWSFWWKSCTLRVVYIQKIAGLSASSI